MAKEKKYIAVTGGVLSGVGKGISASSIGAILQSKGYTVTFIKIDPYINLDAGTLNPFDHGEVYVLEDGTEVDLDLGNYERFLDISLTGEHSMTTGKIYNEIIKKERKGTFLGKTVQIVPHLTNLVKERILEISSLKIKCGISFKEDFEKKEADICIIELGGTVGDIESFVFVESLRQLKREVGSNFLVISVEFLPELSNGDQKTKPIQNSCKKSASLGIKPDLIICRCEKKMKKEKKEKISNFCEVKENDIFEASTLKCVYDLPSELSNQGIFLSLKKHLNLEEREEAFCLKEKFGIQASEFGKKVKVSIVGKYVGNDDCYISLHNAVKFSAASLGVEAEINWVEASDLEEKGTHFLLNSDCIIVPGGFGPRGVEGKIKAIEFARKNKIPFLGICLGFQLAVVEFARNILGMKEANSEEFINNEHNVIVYLNQYNQKTFGGTMRLGNKQTLLSPGRIQEWYKVEESIYERHRHRYEVNLKIIPQLEEKGLVFVGKNESGERMEVFDYKEHPFFVGVQFHPEFNARPNSPHCLFDQLILHGLKRN